MRCKTCDYPLWNLRTRTCPECGEAFAPSEFEFAPNTVRFCCPHCNQAYYGTDEHGHLDPTQFDCVTCGNAVDMDEMVLLPAEGFDERDTGVPVNSWLVRDRVGRWKGWLRAVGGALWGQFRLIRGTPIESPLGQAWWFVLVTLTITYAVSFIPAMAFVVAMPFIISSAGGASPGGPGPVAMLAIMGGSILIGLAFGFVITVAWTGVWGLATHGLLRITGPCGPLRRTMQAICYSGGALVTSAIPCFGGYVSLPWWVVSAVLMIKEGHKVGGGRATFAAVTPPVCAAVAFVALYAIFILAIVTQAGPGMSAPAVTSAQETQAVLSAVMVYAADHDGRGPAHGAELVTADALAEWEFMAVTTATAPQDVPVGSETLESIMMMPERDRGNAVAAAAAGLGEGTIAHRVGDFVFTHHGIDLDTADPALWIVVFSPDPDSNATAGQPYSVVVGRADGTVRQILRIDFQNELASQNTLRAEHGLPPLPDPATVTHH